MDKLQKPELLIPAGSLEVLKVAVDYGADAVYIGGKNYGLRAKAGNFTIEEMHEAADYVHAHGAKLYVTVNIFAHNEDIDGIKAYFHELKETGLEEKIDAFIISDPGIFTLAKEILPGIEIHVSTQANNTNYLIYDFWRKQGATRVVAARDTGQCGQYGRHMKTKKVVRKIFDTLNYSKKLKISSILPDRDSDYAILLELEDGSKFEIIIIPTRRFV